MTIIAKILRTMPQEATRELQEMQKWICLCTAALCETLPEVKLNAPWIWFEDFDVGHRYGFFFAIT